MLTRILATVALTVGAVSVATGVASADDYDFYQVQDRTDYFVAPLDPGAIIGDRSGYPIILSPYGTTRTIECRGDGHYVQVHECVQFDANDVPRDVVKVWPWVREMLLFVP